MKRHTHGTSIEKRIIWVLFFFFAVFAILFGRLFSVQIISHNQYLGYAERQQGIYRELTPARGSIFASDKTGELVPLAANRNYKNLILAPSQVKDLALVRAILSRDYLVDQAKIEELLAKKNDPYEIIAKKLTPSEEEKRIIDETDGLFFEDELKRVYPYDSLASRVLGFVGASEDDTAGKYGLEREYNNLLSGSPGIFTGVKDAKGFLLAIGERIVEASETGSDIVLTIDYNVQVKAREALLRAQEKWAAPSGIVIVLEPDTGKILAMDALPAFNPNEYNKERDLSVFLNPVVESVFELGSVMKPITMSAGIEEKKVTPQSTYTDTGSVKVLDREIKNFDGKGRGVQTMTNVLEKSLNTGAVYVSRLLGPEKQKEYIYKFGFGEESGIDLPGERAGDLKNIERGHEVELATAAFGQGIAVTPLQMAVAMGAIANGGKLMRPYIVEEVRSGNHVLSKTEPEVRRVVISKDTSEKITQMLVSVVRNGFEKRASVKGYFIAGKTGTAQVPRKDGKGYSDESIHTLIGYAPAFNPKFLIYMQLNEPTGNRFAANTLTPSFYDLAEYMLNYYEIPPDDN